MRSAGYDRVMTRWDQCDETCTADCGHCKGGLYPEPDFGEVVRTQFAATGRYVSKNRVLYISAQDNDLSFAPVHATRMEPQRGLPLPTDAEIEKAVSCKYGWQATCVNRH